MTENLTYEVLPCDDLIVTVSENGNDLTLDRSVPVPLIDARCLICLLFRTREVNRNNFHCCLNPNSQYYFVDGDEGVMLMPQVAPKADSHSN
jgi:hypothetical protein